MQLSRGLTTINSSYADTVALVICISLGGTGFLVLATFVITKYRLRRELLIAQDTLPRPFEVTVPAATTTNTWTRARNLVSVGPMRTVSPISYSRNGQRGRSTIGREETSTRLVPLRASSTPTSVITTPGQFQSSSSRTTHIQPCLSNTSLLSNRAAPSSVRFPPRSQSHLHTQPISLNPRSRSGLGAQPGQSSSSYLVGTQLQGAAGVFPSASIRERRSAKRALWLSRSASELHCASISAPHHRQPPSGGYTPPLDRRSELHVDTRVRPTNYLRQSRSASQFVRVGRTCWDSEEDLGSAVVFQHEDAGLMKELPPPYHKVILSS